MAEAAAAAAAPTPAPAPAATPAPAAAASPATATSDPPVLTDATKPAEVPALTDPAKAEAKPAEAKPAEAAPFDVKALKLPEGFKADDASLKTFSDLVNDGSLSRAEFGQKAFDFYVGALRAAGEAGDRAWDDTQRDWQGKVKADPEIGGDKLPATLQGISKMIDTLGPDGAKGFREALKVTGAGNHPAVVKALAKFAPAFTEGRHVPGNPAAGKADLKEVFFPNSPDMK